MNHARGTYDVEASGVKPAKMGPRSISTTFDYSDLSPVVVFGVVVGEVVEPSCGGSSVNVSGTRGGYVLRSSTRFSSAFIRLGSRVSRASTN